MREVGFASLGESGSALWKGTSTIQSRVVSNCLLSAVLFTIPLGTCNIRAELGKNGELADAVRKLHPAGVPQGT